MKNYKGPGFPSELPIKEEKIYHEPVTCSSGAVCMLKATRAPNSLPGSVYRDDLTLCWNIAAVHICAICCKGLANN